VPHTAVYSPAEDSTQIRFGFMEVTLEM